MAIDFAMIFKIPLRAAAAARNFLLTAENFSAIMYIRCLYEGRETVQDIRDIPITALRGVGPAKQAAYARLGVFTVGDLLYHFPRAYENRGNVKRLCDTDAPTFFYRSEL